MICPLTSKVVRNSEILRVHLEKGVASLRQECDILIDQLRAIDNKRLIKKLGVIPVSAIDSIKENLKIVLDLA